VRAATDEKAAGRVYNVGDAAARLEIEWTRAVARAAGYRGDVLPVPPEATPAHLQPPGNTEQHWTASTARIRAELGFAEIVPEAEALRRTIEWERAHPPAHVDPAQFDYAAEDAALAAFPHSPR
jgi:nucleoside-diphosphate-sugar epimerase